MLERLQAINPPILTGYAGAIEALADHVVCHRRPDQAAARGLLYRHGGHRPVPRARRAGFQAPAVDVFVTNEFGVVAWSVPATRDVLHINDDGFVIEVLAPDGTPAAPGQVGELVVTSLGLTAMPLIRYRMGDMAARLEGPASAAAGSAC